MAQRGTRIAFVGGGTMAGAMVRGLLERKLVTPKSITVSGPRRERRAELVRTYRVKAVASNSDAARGVDVVVMSVKPQVLPRVMAELRGRLTPDQLVLSIVAGASRGFRSVLPPSRDEAPTHPVHEQRHLDHRAYDE